MADKPKEKTKSFSESVKGMARGVKEVFWDSMKTPPQDLGYEIGYCGKKGKKGKNKKRRN